MALESLVNEFNRRRDEWLGALHTDNKPNPTAVADSKNGREIEIKLRFGDDTMTMAEFSAYSKRQASNEVRQEKLVTKPVVIDTPVEPNKALVKTIDVCKDSAESIANEMQIACDTVEEALLKPAINVDYFYRNQTLKQGRSAEDQEKIKWYYKYLISTTNHYWDRSTGLYKGFYDALEEQPFYSFDGNIVLCKDGKIYCGDSDKEKEILKRLVPFNLIFNAQQNWKFPGKSGQITNSGSDERLVPDFINEYIRPLVEEQNVILWRPHHKVQTIKIAIVRSVVNAGYLYKSLDYYKEGQAKFDVICSDIGLKIASGFRVTDPEADQVYEKFIGEMQTFVPAKYNRILNIIETICASDPKKFDKLAVVWAKIYMGKDFLKSAFDIEQKDVLLLNASNIFFLKQVISAAFDFDGKHGNEYNHAPYCLQLKDMRSSERISNVLTTNRLLKTKKMDASISFLPLAELGEKTNVPKLLMAKLHGNIVNICLQDAAGECDFKRVKQVFNGKGITYNNKIFGEQVYRSNNMNCIIAHPGAKVESELKEEGISYETVSLANNIPINRVALGDGQTLTEDETVFMNIVLAMWGTHCILNGEANEEGQDKKIFAEFVEDCFDSVSVEEPKDSESCLVATAANGTTWATVEAMYKSYYLAATGQEFAEKINRDFCDKHGIRTNGKQQRCKPIIQRDYDKGYREDIGELPKDGPTNFCIGIVIKSKNYVEEKCKKKAAERVMPVSMDARKQFFVRFAEAITTTVTELRTGIH